MFSYIQRFWWHYTANLATGDDIYTYTAHYKGTTPLVLELKSRCRYRHKFASYSGGVCIMWVWYRVASFPGARKSESAFLTTRERGLVQGSLIPCRFSPWRCSLLPGNEANYKVWKYIITRFGSIYVQQTHGDVPCKVSTTDKQAIAQQ